MEQIYFSLSVTCSNIAIRKRNHQKINICNNKARGWYSNDARVNASVKKNKHG